ncbi:TonB-dependent receptor [Chitinophaga sp. G-6-1-13]|uniref:TonB-dependent receptor n=1 Tax=Chitinophaga fulva TaxID=2728842 RepID=A0A848GW53_9BACT|nr:outer membrane beta-barrel family protein [Chitinophaga fulva]NML40913.1 TonB-dependent receptor [Chitinophaga fulva]
MKSILTAFVLTAGMISAALTSQAQNGPKVAGKVIRTGEQPVEFATITLLKAGDSSLVKGAIADINGKYEFEQIKQGKYLIAAAAVGMNRAYSKPFEVGASGVTVPALAMEAASKSLKAVDVTARKPFIEQKADKMVVNVESSITAAGGNAMEVLEKSPTINVDKDGNISMKGKGGVVIMIDGKPTNMTSQDVAELLKSMPASNLEQIELIANPSAKYDAAGNAGIINLKLKKNKSYGTNGNVNLGVSQGVRSRANGALNLNHRNEKVNIFGSYNYSYRRQEQELGVYRTMTNEGRYQVFDQNTGTDQKSDYQGGKIGMDYFISKNHTLGVMADLSRRDRNMSSDAITKIGNGNLVDSILHTNSGESGRWQRGAYNLNYRGILDSTGKELNIDLDYARITQKLNSSIFALNRDGADKALLNSDTSRNGQPSSIEIKSAKIDYVHPLKGQAKLEAGAKVSFVTTDNDARFDSLRTGSWIKDERRSNHFIYKENINAAYININKQFKKVFVQIGLRGEQTHITGNSAFTQDQQAKEIRNDSSYFNLFPSAAMSYQLNKNNTLGLTYSRRIQRPDYEELNPFEFYLDRYTRIAGNPGLKPQYSNNFEVTHTFREFLTTSLAYTHTKDMMTKILEAAVDPVSGDTSAIRYRYQNVAKSDVFNLNISATVPITKWWTSFTTASLSHSMYETVVDKNNVKLSSFGFFGRTQQTFTITKDMSAEAVFFYVSPQLADEGLFRMKAMYGLDLGVQQKVLKGKGSVKLGVTDVFRTNYFRGQFENVGRTTSIFNRWDSRQVRLSFNYRFGNSNVKAARNRETGLEAEQNRVKGGN